MKLDQLLEARRPDWNELDAMTRKMPGRRQPHEMLHFAALYRSACADLALADAYQLPADTVEYLHQLVGRAHNRLYRSRPFQVHTWMRELFVIVPRRLFADRFLHLAFVIFWGVFALAAVLTHFNPDFGKEVLPPQLAEQLEHDFSQPLSERSPGAAGAMVGFYIWHNTDIGLQCFAFGLLLGVGGLFITVFNAALLGAVFGHMATTPQAGNFYQFVTAHSAFELTAVVLSSAAGMRLGFALIDTRGLTRLASLQRAAREAMPTMAATMVLFALAALIEAFVSPSAAPYWFKAAVCVLSAAMLFFYYAGLGGWSPLPPGEDHAT